MKLAIVHHTATGNSYSAQDSARIVRSIYTYHVKSNGWDDIGYNFLVDRHGQIFEGRSGGVGRAVIGAHAQGFNTGSSGIAVIGTFSTARPPAAAWESLKRITAWRLDRAYINPLGSTTMTSGGSSSWPAGQKVTLQNVSAHRDVGNTSCPGQSFYDALGALRSEVAAHGDPKLYYPSRSRTTITPNADGLADVVQLTMRFSSGTYWKIDLIDPSGRSWRSWSGSGKSASVSWSGDTASGKLVPQYRYRFRISGNNGRGSLRPTDLSANVWRFPNGTLLRSTSGSAWILEKQRLRRLLPGGALATRYHPHEEVSVPDGVKNVYPLGKDIGFRDGSITKVDGKLWLISDQKRRPVSQATLDTLGYQRDAIIATTAAALSPHPVGEQVIASTAHPNGTALRGSDVREAVVLTGQARPFPTRNVRASYRIRNVDLAGPADAEVAASSAQAPVGFRDGTLLKTSSSSAIYVIVDGYRRRIVSSPRFAALGYKSSNVKTVTPAELALHPEGEPL